MHQPNIYVLKAGMWKRLKGTASTLGIHIERKKLTYGTTFWKISAKNFIRSTSICKETILKVCDLYRAGPRSYKFKDEACSLPTYF